MLEERMETFLPLLKKYGFKIISNMGAANIQSAIAKIKEIAKSIGVTGLKIAYVMGDDITDRIHDYDEVSLMDSEGNLKRLNNIISANIYLGGDNICRALDDGADIVITGRIADASLFVAPILHEFKWDKSDYDKIGQALLVGHMMECCSQLTGGYYADPGYKDIENLHLLGQPIAEIDETGKVIFTKVEGSGGKVCIDICKEQLLYEIADPSHYITPDGIADFSKVRFKETGRDMVEATNASSRPATDTYKVNIGYMEGYIGVGEVSYGGANSLKRAELAADIIQKRWKIIGITPLESRIDYIGYNSLYRDIISKNIHTGDFSEIRLRIAVRTNTQKEAEKLIRELQCMYINGPAGSSGIESYVEPVLSIDNILIPKQDITATITLEEI